MVASDKSFELIQNQTKPNQNQKHSQNPNFGKFLAYSDMLSMEKHVIKIESLMVGKYFTNEEDGNSI